MGVGQVDAHLLLHSQSLKGIIMNSSPQNPPFVSFPVGTAPSAAIESGSGPDLEYLGKSSAGDLYLNRDFASIGLVCSSSVSVFRLSPSLQPVLIHLTLAYMSD
jgi:hypothetical protein